MENVIAYTNYNAIFTRIFGRLMVAEHKDALIASIERQENSMIIQQTDSVAENLYFAHVLTLKALAYLEMLPTNPSSASEQEDMIKLHSLITYLEMKDLALPSKVHKLVYPSGHRAQHAFDPTGGQAEKLWEGEGFASVISKLFSNINLEKPSEAHDCDTCNLKGRCPIEDDVRAMKKEEEEDKKDSTIITQTIHIVPPKSPNEIN